MRRGIHRRGGLAIQRCIGHAAGRRRGRRRHLGRRGHVRGTRPHQPRAEAPAHQNQRHQQDQTCQPQRTARLDRVRHRRDLRAGVGVGQRQLPRGGPDRHQLIHHGPRALGPLRAILAQQGGDEPGQRRRGRGADLIDGLGLLVHDAIQCPRDGVGVERQPTGQRLVGNGPQREQIRALVHVGVPRLGHLGRHVVRRAEDLLGAGERGQGPPHLGDPEVQHLDLRPPVVARAEEDVGGLEVPVQHALVVRRGQGRADLAHDRDQHRGGHPSVDGQPLGQILTLQQLHHHERRSVGQRVEVQHVDDVAVSQAAANLRLTAEPLQRIGVVTQRLAQDLDRHRAREPHMLAGIDHAHRPVAHQVLDAVGPGQQLPRQGVGARGVTHHGAHQGSALLTLRQVLPHLPRLLSRELALDEGSDGVVAQTGHGASIVANAGPGSTLVHLTLRLRVDQRRHGPAGEAVEHRDQRVDQVEEAVGHVGPGRDPQRADHIGPAGVPRDQHRGQRPGVLQRTGQILGRQPPGAVGLTVHPARHHDGEVLVRAQDVHPQAGHDGGQHQPPRAAGGPQHRAGQRLQLARRLHHPAEAHGADDQRHGGEHGRQTAAGEQLVHQRVAGAGLDALERHQQPLPRRAPLHRDAEDRAQAPAAQHGRHGRDPQHHHGDDHQRRQQQQRVDHEGVAEHGLDRLHLTGIRRLALAASDDRVEHQGDEQARSGGVDHVPDVVEQLSPGHGRRQVGGVRQRRHLVAEVGAGDHRPRHPRPGDAEPLPHADEGDAHGGGGGPRRAGGQGHQAADDAGGHEEHRRGEQLQPVVDHGRHDAGVDPRSDQHADHQQDDAGLGRQADAAHHRVLDLVPAQSQLQRDEGGHHGAEDQRHVGRQLQLRVVHHRQVQRSDQRHHRQQGGPHRRHRPLALHLVRHRVNLTDAVHPCQGRPSPSAG